MISIGKKILHLLILFLTLVAMIGVNVRQIYCFHGGNLCWVVQILPDDAASLCDGDCCKTKECHSEKQHDYYKVTDFSREEHHVDWQIADFGQILEFAGMPVFYTMVEKSFFSKGTVHFTPLPERSMLCTYLC